MNGETPPDRASLHEGPPAKRVYQATRLAEASPTIDGRLDDPAWQHGEWAGDFVQREPNEGQPGSEPTELKILYDDANIYVAIRAFDSQIDTLQFQRGARDEFTGDMVGIAFDSYYDQRTSFEFNVTAGGSQIDLILRNDGADRSWNAVWEVKVDREPDAWTAEFRIPLSQLRYASNKPDQVWGLHSWRWIKRRQEESNWQLIPMDNPGFVYSFGELRGISDLQPPRQIEVVPYLVARHSTFQAEPGNPYRTGSATDLTAGLDAKIGLSSDFIVDLTINPDFGQVEADPAEINLSTFETFYPERRPFFLEGKNIFEFEVARDQLFYSRRIGHHPSFEPETDGFTDMPTATRIIGAAKLSGKNRNGLAVGALYGLTAAETARITEAGDERIQIVEPQTHYLVTRVQQDFNKGETVLGGIFTATRRNLNDDALAFLPDQALTGGLDLRHHWHERTYYLDLKLMGSRVEGSTRAITELMETSRHNYQRPDASHLGVDRDARQLAGWGGKVEVGKDANGRWRYEGGLEWSSPGLELNDLGFMAVADRVSQSAALAYVVTDPGPLLRSHQLRLRQSSGFDYSGEHLQDSLGFNGNVVFNNNWRAYFYGNYNGQNKSTHTLRGGPALLRPASVSGGIFIRSDTTKNFGYSLDLDRAAAFAGGSRFTGIAPGVSYRVSDAINVRADVNYRTNLEDSQYVNTAETGADVRYLMGRMDRRTLGSTLRFDVSFTPQLTLSYYGNVYATAGEFTGFKAITDPLASRYEDRFRRLDGAVAFDPTTDTYAFVEDETSFTFENPDFNGRSFQSNLVLRWEYRPGSTMYLVWTQHRDDDERVAFSPASEFQRLFSAPPANTLLVKFSYWFSI